MGDNSTIEWTDATWNPLIGCSRTSPGCDHCYAIGVVHRGMSPQHVGLTVKAEGSPTDWTGEVRPVPHLLDLPLRWKRPRRVFVNSLSDLFHRHVGVNFIAEVFAVMSLAEAHTFQLLTKRAGRMSRVLTYPGFLRLVDDHRERLRPGCGDFTWPLPNVWLGVSIESDRYTFRADHLRRTPAAVRWISAEPLLGPLPSLDLTSIDWLVAGGESGANARPMHPDWVRELRDNCIEGVPVAFHFKQWGHWAPSASVRDIGPRGVVLEHDGEARTLIDAVTATYRDSAAAPMVPVGKRASGRQLDGRTWDEFPA